MGSLLPLPKKNSIQHYFTLIKIHMAITEATNNRYMDSMLDGHTGTLEVRFQQAAVTGRCRGLGVIK